MARSPCAAQFSGRERFCNGGARSRGPQCTFQRYCIYRMYLIATSCQLRPGMNLPSWGCRATIIALVFFAIPARSQDAYPNRAVKIIAPVASGTVADLVPRLIADKLATRWGQAVIVE